MSDTILTEDEKNEAAADWSDFRRDYGLDTRHGDDLLRVQHRAFIAGWTAGRHGEQGGVLR